MRARKSPGAWACCLALACGPAGPGETESQSSSSSESTSAPGTSTSSEDGPTTTGASTGSGLECELGDGEIEGQDPDPDDCYGITDPDACEALEADATCLAIWGRKVECRGEALCSATSPVFLGCRPWAICKTHSLLVCQDGEAGTQVFWADECLPAGFYPCAPSVGDAPPPACE